jgi:hypothetical protein
MLRRNASLFVCKAHSVRTQGAVRFCEGRAVVQSLTTWWTNASASSSLLNVPWTSSRRSCACAAVQ